MHAKQPTLTVKDRRKLASAARRILNDTPNQREIEDMADEALADRYQRAIGAVGFLLKLGVDQASVIDLAERRIRPFEEVLGGRLMLDEHGELIPDLVRHGVTPEMAVA